MNEIILVIDIRVDPEIYKQRTIKHANLDSQGWAAINY